MGTIIEVEDIETLGDVITNYDQIVAGMTSEPYLISIGNNVTISSGTRFVTHDNSICKCENSAFTDVVGKIRIGDNVFIGMGSIVMYGVSIADNTIIGSGSVVTKSIFDGGGMVRQPC